MEKCAAIVLAAGRGSRMGTATEKQYLSLREKPVLYWSLKAFQDCPFIDRIVLVASKERLAYCREQFVEGEGFDKITSIIPGGSQRYDSVYAGLCACDGEDFVFIHDSARPMLTQEILLENLEKVRLYGACVSAVPSKDTVKLSDGEGMVSDTPPRERVFIVQTPQTFSLPLIKSAHEKARLGDMSRVTDDAMLIESYTDCKVALAMGTYENIKITTKEDLLIAEAFLQKLL